MQGKATLGGHPIHPMLIPLPIGFFIGSLVCDIITYYQDPAFFSRMSEVLIGFGIIGALLAAVFGLIDYTSAPMSDGAKRTATTHLILNLVLVAVYAVDFYLRLSNPIVPAGYVLSVIGVILLGISGYLGGHLSFVGHVGVEEQPTTIASGRTETGTVEHRSTRTTLR